MITNPTRDRYRLNRLADLLSGGERLRGGCNDCDAYQTIKKTSDTTFNITVHHDHTCPFLSGRT